MKIENKKRYIIVQESGFVRIGEVVRNNHQIFGEVYTITNNYIIRVWGTKNGLGQLATQGKTSATVLDYEGTTHIPVKKVLHFIEIKEGVKL